MINHCHIMILERVSVFIHKAVLHIESSTDINCTSEESTFVEREAPRHKNDRSHAGSRPRFWRVLFLGPKGLRTCSMRFLHMSRMSLHLNLSSLSCFCTLGLTFFHRQICPATNFKSCSLCQELQTTHSHPVFSLDEIQVVSVDFLTHTLS